MSIPAAEERAETVVMTEKGGRFRLKLDESEPRGEWSSRFAFYMATTGAAVGFGNVWRFPSLAVEYGGGAFFVPYLLALFLLGLPLAVLEIGFGQYFQTGDIGVFGTFHPRLRGVGLASVGCGFMVLTYYVTLIGWVANSFFSSWSNDSPWSNPSLTGEEAVNYFLDTIVGGSTVPASGLPTRIVGRNAGFAFMTWLIIFLCVAWGVKWAGRVAYATMGIPIVLIFIFLGKALTLEGSSDGVREYIGIWDMSILITKGEVWSVACSQIFFSIGLTFGILTAFGSHCPRSEPACFNATVVCLANSLFSFIAGFAVMAALGHLALLDGKEVTDLEYSGYGLVFGTWPVVFNTLPGGIQWVRLIFFNLFLLGIDSAFAFLEGFITVLQDTIFFEKVPRIWLALCVSCVGFIFSLIYCTDSGIAFLDTVDFYINFVMILVGFFEAFGSGWAYDIIGQIERQSAPVVYSFMIANFGSVILGCILWYAFDIAAFWGFIGFFGWYIVFVALTGYFINKVVASSDGKWTTRSLWWEVYLGNIVELRDRMQLVIGRVPLIWCVLMRLFIPHVLIILFVNLAVSKTDTGKSMFGNFGGFSHQPYQILGILIVVFTLVLFMGGVFFPKIYAPLSLPQTDEAKEEMKKYDITTDGASVDAEVVEEPTEMDKKIETAEFVEKDI